MSIGYVFKEGVVGLKRAKLAAFTSMFSLFIAVLLIAVLFRIGYNIYELSNVIRQQVEVEVFLEPAEESVHRNFGDLLLERNEIIGLEYISADSAASIFQQEFGFGAESIAQLNFLPASYKVMMSDELTVTQIDSIVKSIQPLEQVDEIRFNLSLLQIIEERTDTMLFAGAGVGLFILFVAIILVFNTIRLTIYAKSDLIQAMKLVGATNGFIRKPFLVEGILQGLIGGLAASGTVYALFEWGVPEFIPQLGVLSWPFGRWYFLIGGILILGMTLGWFGSRWAARKFIKNSRVG